MINDHNNTSEPAHRLTPLLRAARPVPVLPPQFAVGVWRRIEACEAEAPGGPGWLLQLADWLAQPRRALTALAVLLLLGTLTGLVQGWERSHEAARARYLAIVNPLDPGP